jgi:predicted outer membrane repeat protein
MRNRKMSLLLGSHLSGSGLSMKGAGSRKMRGAVVLVATSTMLLMSTTSATADRPLTVCHGGCDATSLEEALSAANNGDRIVIAAGTWPAPPPSCCGTGGAIEKSVSLIGAGAGETIIVGYTIPPGTFVVGYGPTLTIAPGVSVELRRLALAGGGDPGGALINEGDLVLQDVSIRDSLRFANGGGITNSGTMTLERTTVTGNRATGRGGGIYNSGTMTLKNSLVEGNQGLTGGGIFNEGTMTLKNTTVTGNHAFLNGPPGHPGGGIFNLGTLNLKNSSVIGNFPDDCVSC